MEGTVPVRPPWVNDEEVVTLGELVEAPLRPGGKNVWGFVEQSFGDAGHSVAFVAATVERI